MSTYSVYRQSVFDYRDGAVTSVQLLGALSRYLADSADFPAIAEVLKDDLGYDLDRALAWFGEQDFPDFAEAVGEGWGWPE